MKVKKTFRIKIISWAGPKFPTFKYKKLQTSRSPFFGTHLYVSIMFRKTRVPCHIVHLSAASALPTIRSDARSNN